MDEEDELKPLQRVWVNDEYTRRLLKQLRKAEQEHLAHLLTACKKSTDPSIALRSGLLTGASAAVKMFESGQSKPGTKP